jgi:signal transduction histidine kinase
MTKPAMILVIDSELSVREDCKRALTPYGFSVDTAEDGDEGLRKVQSGSYDLVLLDVMMPGVSGIDLLASIHEHDPEIVCIIITGYATVELAVKAIRQGAYYFLTKPFTSDDLRLAVNQGVERRRLSLEAKRAQEAEARARQLAEEKVHLEELDRAKLAFIRLVTHELQAPVGAIQSYLRLILDGFIPPERHRQYIERAEIRAEELLTLITDLLELGRVQEVKTRQQSVLVQVDDVLRNVVEEVQDQVVQKDLRLSADIAADLPPVRAIPDQIKSVWVNLIGNAIKYTPSGGVVEISLRCDGGQIVGQVRDTGIGIPAEAQGWLFTEFFRADNAKALNVRGTGVGLAIAKQIVEGAGGRIWAESDASHGSTFTFVLPAATAPTPG